MYVIAIISIILALIFYTINVLLYKSVRLDSKKHLYLSEK